MREGVQPSKSSMESDKGSAQSFTYDQLLARVQVLEEGLRLALDNSMMPRQLIASLMALLPEKARGAIDSTPQDYRED